MLALLLPPRTTDLCEVVNAILYIGKTSCRCRLLSKEFPPFPMVQRNFCKWQQDGTLKRNLAALRRQAPGAELLLRQDLDNLRAGPSPRKVRLIFHHVIFDQTMKEGAKVVQIILQLRDKARQPSMREPRSSDSSHSSIVHLGA